MKSLFNRENMEKPVIPYVDFSNHLEGYTIKIHLPEHMKENVKVETCSNYVIVRISDFYKKIYLYEPIDKNSIKTWYHQGVYGVEISKSYSSPEERLNQWALVMGI